MPAPYNGTLAEDANEFDYNGTHYGSGDNFGPFNACEALGFINAAQQANPTGGLTEEQQKVVDTISAECPATSNTASPQPAPVTPPVETNPVTTGGDSATQQAAPTPPVSGRIGGTPSNEPPPPPTEESTRPPGGEPHPTHGGDQSQSQTTAGDPVDMFSGAFYLQETDLEVPNTILPLSFVRVYRSGAAAFGPFGWNWDHNYNSYIRELNNGDIALWRLLHEDIFTFDGINFEAPRGVFEKLERIPGLAQAFIITSAGGSVMRFERPNGWIDGERIPLIEIKDRHGNKQTFSYDAADKLAEVKDDDDRFLKFAYDQCGLLVTITDHANRKYEYEHDEETMQLTCVTSPVTSDHPRGIKKIYHYEQPFALPELRHNIIRVEDSEGNIYVENSYEQDPASWHFARVIEQLFGGFLYQFQYTQLQWVPANPLYINLPAVRVEVMNPDFGLETYTFNYRGDLLDRRYRLNKDKSFRVVVCQYEFDEQGNLSITTDADGSQKIDTYDFANPDPRMRGKLVQKEITAASGFPAPSRIIWKAKYEASYQLLSEEKDELGAITDYKYDFDISPGAMTNSGKLVELHHPDVTLPNGSTQSSVTKYESNNKGQVTAIILPDGSRQEIIYGTSSNEKSRLIKRIFAVGSLDIENQVKYDAFGFDTELIDSNGNSIKTIRNSLGLLEKTILPQIGGTSPEYRLHYDNDKKVIASERPKGDYIDVSLIGNHIIDNFERDVLGYLSTYVLSSNTLEARTIRICPDFRGLPQQIDYPDGRTVKRTYDERGLLVNEQEKGHDGITLSSRKVYDRTGKLIQDIDSFGMKTVYEYDGFARVSKVTLPNQTQIKRTWSKGDLLESEEVFGDGGFGNRRLLAKKVFKYDEKGRKIAETIQAFRDNPALAIDVTTTWFFDRLDRIERIVSNRGGVTSFQYDGLGRLIAEIDPMGNENYNDYDNNGNLIRTENHHKEPNASISIFSKNYTYDARNRKTETIEPDGAIFKEEYDDRDLVVRQTDYSGIIKAVTYNSFHNRINETFDVGGLAISHQWLLDNMSRPHTYIDPTGQISKYHVDSLARIDKTEYPNGFLSTKVFNSIGQVESETLASGVTFEYGYDSANRLVKIKNTVVPASIGQLADHDFVYDGFDRIVSAKLGSDEILREYDSMGRLLLEQSNGNNMECSYNDTNGTVAKIWPDGRTETYSHDLNNITISIQETTNGSLGAGNNLITILKPSGKNNFGEALYQGGLKVVNTYDERKRLVEIAVTSPVGLSEKINYRYNIDNKKQIEAITGQQSKLSYFEYDKKDRLRIARDGFVANVSNASTQAQHDMTINAIRLASTTATHEEKFEYDSSDARTKYTETAVPAKNYTYLPGHRIQNDGTNNYLHHSDGTLQTDGLLTYEVDALGRVLSIRSGMNLISSIEYDALGRPSRIKEMGQPDKDFNYFGGFVEQENENGNPSRQISSHPVTGLPIAYHITNATHYTLFDSRFNLVGVTNTNGDLLESFRYKAFGLPQIYDSSGNILVTSGFGIEPYFGGQRYLSSCGLYLSKRRLMNPLNGAFLSIDPNGYVDSSSLYVYGAQDPVNNIDPNGEIIPFIIAAFVIGGAVAGAGYSLFDAYHHPERYEGAAGVWRPLANTFGGAAIGAVAVVGGEAVLAIGGTGAFATGAGASTLTVAQSFALYGTSSALSGAVLRGGFNAMFPEYVDPVTARSVTIDFVAGGTIGSAFRSLTAYAESGTFGRFPSIPGTGRFSNWLRFGADAGGSAAETGSLGPYAGRIGAWLDRIGIRQGTASSIVNNDLGGNAFAAIDTGAHEGFHALVARYLPTFRNLSLTNRLGAIARYPEEVVAYALGHGAAGRVHGIPFAPFEAFNSLAGYGASEVQAAKIFWGRLTGATGVGLAEHLFSDDQPHPNELVSSK